MLLLTGVASIAVGATTRRLPILAAIGLLVSAFASYALLLRPRSLRASHPTLRRHLMTLASMTGALAALIVALLVLAGVVGGSIEVMRR